MAKTSAGILAFRHVAGNVEVFLVHPGGPFYARKDAGSWTIPKGEFGEDEDALTAAKREFKEETGIQPDGGFVALKPFKQKGGKMIYAWAWEADFDAELIRSNMFEMEWPPRSGRMQSFPEVDRGAWFEISDAMEKILESQKVMLEEFRNQV